MSTLLWPLPTASPADCTQLQRQKIAGMYCALKWRHAVKATVACTETSCSCDGAVTQNKSAMFRARFPIHVLVRGSSCVQYVETSIEVCYEAVE